MNVENDKKYLNADQAPAVEREKTVKMWDKQESCKIRRE